jgi:predicted permease
MKDRFRALIHGLMSYLRRDALDADLRDEIESHLALATDEYVSQGLPPAEARRRALLALGGIGQAEERHRDARGLAVLDVLGQDLRHAVRTMIREPAFAGLAVLVLGLAIGANTVVFGVVNTLLLRPLPFPASDRLTWFSSGRDSIAKGRDPGGLSSVTYTVDAFEAFERHAQSYDALTAYDPFFGDAEFTMTGIDEPQPVAGVRVAQDFFQTLGVAPTLGRSFTEGESRGGGPGAVVLAHAFWVRHFGGDPRAVGRVVRLGGAPATIVGVMPESFDFGSVFAPGVAIDAFVPVQMDVLRTWGNTLAIVGRMKPGVDVARAQGEADVLFRRLQAEHTEWFGDYTSHVTTLKDHVTGHVRRALVVLWCAVGAIMLIACVNLANLLLARTAARSRELAMRTALGATRGRLAAQLLTESLVLSAAGAVAGVTLAVAITAYLSRQASIALPLLASVRVDAMSLAWTIGVAVAAAMMCGTLPALRLAGGDVQRSLGEASRGSTAGRQHEALRAALVVSEVALACVLLVGSGLLLRSFVRVLDIDLGFRPEQAATMRAASRGSTNEQRSASLHAALTSVRAVPGVTAAGVVDMLPLGRNRSWGLAAKGRAYERDEDYICLIRIVTPGYIEAMGMTMRSGRDFTWQDGTPGHLAVIVNEAGARRHWGSLDPVGRTALLSPTREALVVGVVADVRQQSVESDVGCEMFQPMAQADPEGAQLVVRTTRPLDGLSAEVLRALRSVNPSQPAGVLEPVQAIVDRSTSPRRFFVALVGAFAGLGLLLAALGVYGVISYGVAQRRREIGIRMALGASAPQVQRGVLGQSLRLVLPGLALGVAGALALMRLVTAMLFRTEPTDPPVFGAIVLLLGAVSVAAAYLPARRATRVDPTIALRDN